MIKVSIIIPIYQVPSEYLKKCFDSLVSQTMQDCEFILVSDGAPELEISICNEYAKKDSRFKVFQREHAGVSSTRNYALIQAQGEYITFVDSDDWIEPQTCQSTYDFAKQNDSDIVIWDSNVYYDGQVKKTIYASESFDLLSKDQKSQLIHTAIYPANFNESSIAFISCKLIKREILTLNNIEFPSQLRCSEDRFFHIQCFLHSNRISYLKEHLYFYRIHNYSASRKYTPNAYFEYTKFISLLSPTTQKEYSVSIDLEYIHSFFLSWPTCYMHKENRSTFFQRMRELTKIVKSKHFYSVLNRVSLKKLPFQIRIELRLLRNGITLPIYLHGLKALLVK